MNQHFCNVLGAVITLWVDESSCQVAVKWIEVSVKYISACVASA